MLKEMEAIEYVEEISSRYGDKERDVKDASLKASPSYMVLS
jgi:hypothetical protein